MRKKLLRTLLRNILFTGVSHYNWETSSEIQTHNAHSGGGKKTHACEILKARAACPCVALSLII